jgi:ABC-type glycerol-3-phosphate transport system substrate-binding protein
MRTLNRRELLRLAGVGSAAMLLGACQPKVVEVTREVEKIVEKPVEKVVKETVVVEKSVEKVVERTVVVEKSTEIITIRHLIRAGDLGPRYDRALIEFSNSHPSMKAKIEPIPGGDAEYVPKVMAMHAAGSLGDSCWSSIGSVNHYQYADMGITVPLDDLISSRNFDMKPYYANAWDSAKYQGKVFGLPETSHPGTAMLVYNKTLFEKEGVPEPNNDWTLDDLLETAKAFTRDTNGDGRVDMWGFNPSTGRLITMLVRCFSGFEYDLINPDGTKAMVNQPKTQEALRWVTDLYQKHKVAPTPEAMQTGFNQLFMAGRVAMFQTGCWGGPGLSNAMRAKKEWPAEWWLAELPKGPSKVLGSHAELDCQCLTAQSKQKDAAFDFITYLVDKEGSVLRGVPYGCAGSRPDQYEDERLRGTLFTKDDAALFKMYDEINAKAGPYFYPANLHGQEAFQVYQQGLDPLWLGKAEPTDSFFSEVNKQLQVILDKPKAGA